MLSVLELFAELRSVFFFVFVWTVVAFNVDIHVPEKVFQRF